MKELTESAYIASELMPFDNYLKYKTIRKCISDCDFTLEECLSLYGISEIDYIIEELMDKIDNEPNNKEKNRIIFRFIDIKFYKFDLLNSLLRRLHTYSIVSVIKSALVMTQSLPELRLEWLKLNSILSNKI